MNISKHNYNYWSQRVKTFSHPFNSHLGKILGLYSFETLFGIKAERRLLYLLLYTVDILGNYQPTKNLPRNILPKLSHLLSSTTDQKVTKKTSP